MKNSSTEQIVNAVLYEGYILYPYRASSPKNQRERFTFGRIYPAAYSETQEGAEPCMMQAELLLQTHEQTPTGLNICVGFLQPIRREIGVLASPATQWQADNEPIFELVPKLEVEGQLFEPWHEATERNVVLPDVTVTADTPQKLSIPFQFERSRALEPIRGKDGLTHGVIVRQQRHIAGRINVEITPQPNCLKVTVRVKNTTAINGDEIADQTAVIEKTFASAHIIFSVDSGEFISLLEPPQPFENAAKDCQNIGVWPVLVGDEKSSERRTMLASPIILYDWPKIAAESAGPLFDGTEIDEILNLRILTMTDEEKREVRNIDAAARRLLARAENLSGEDFLKMHGTLRNVRPLEEQIFGTTQRLDGVNLGDVYVRCGDRVRIRPKSRADIMDIALDGKIAVIEALEEDAEAKVHLALVVQDDPGRDLGMMRQPGHRFFYTIDEVEPVKEGT